MTPAPFDTSLPSPIATLLELRASGHGAVVDAGRSSVLQDLMRIETGAADAILDLARSATAPALILITGSAGGGKSVLIDELLRRDSAAFGDWIEDATHADSPTEDQMDRLATFLSPVADGATPPAGPPLLLAMNTGMLIRFFDQLRAARGGSHGFTALEATLAGRLALEAPAPAAVDLGGAVTVVNLDGRPTCGTAGSLFGRILAALDPDNPGGVLGGSPRCATCSVTSYCWARTNAKLIASPATAAALDTAAGAAARERGRWPSPRELWDAASHFATGGATFTDPDPCMDVAAAAGNARKVWDHLLITGSFGDRAPRLADDIALSDPSYSATEQAHGILSTAGIDAARDAAAIVAALGIDGADAVATAAQAVAAPDSSVPRAHVARALVRARWLSGAPDLGRATGQRDLFDDALAEYPQLGAGAPLPALAEFLSTVERGFAASFGETLGTETYYRTEAHDTTRPVAVLARADITDYLVREPDAAAAANPAGAELVGHTPLAVDIRLAGVPLSISYPVFRLLAAATRGAVPSTQDLERFSSLKRAAEALGREAAADLDQPLMFVVAGPSNTVARYRASQRRDRITGAHVTAVEDVSGQ